MICAINAKCGKTYTVIMNRATTSKCQLFLDACILLIQKQRYTFDHYYLNETRISLHYNNRYTSKYSFVNFLLIL